ncbi:hypothetical protein DFR74_112184 [Nocardia puris]|uniref:Uncharacterized protein n=1 Tax=Nocardia puris TaxID=208602 RepID=A0A366DAD1_9NOCA|nr:hypothetical protein DFR74_112184 [Nocardia puris]
MSPPPQFDWRRFWIAVAAAAIIALGVAIAINVWIL